MEKLQTLHISAESLGVQLLQLHIWFHIAAAHEHEQLKNDAEKRKRNLLYSPSIAKIIYF